MNYVYYAVVCFGSPTYLLSTYYRSLDRAVDAARAAKGTGTCSAARVVGCYSRSQALKADIGYDWCGRQTVYHA